MTAASRARAPGTARGRSSVSRVRTLLLLGNHPFRYGRRLPEAAGVIVFLSRQQWLAVHETVLDCTFKARSGPRRVEKPREGERVRLRPREPFHDQEAGWVSVLAVSG